MATGELSSVITGRLAVATGVVGLLALACIICFFTLGQPFGTLNDIFIGLTAILSGGLVWALYPRYQAHSSVFSQIALVLALLALVGALVVTIGSVLLLSGITGWYLAGLYMAAGNALIGMWLLGLNYSALHGNLWSRELAIYGMVTGAIMLLGLATLPGIFARVDAWEAAPWYVNYIGQVSALGYLVLYPVWCILLGRTMKGI